MRASYAAIAVFVLFAAETQAEIPAHYVDRTPAQAAGDAFDTQYGGVLVIGVTAGLVIYLMAEDEAVNLAIHEMTIQKTYLRCSTSSTAGSPGCGAARALA